MKRIIWRQPSTKLLERIASSQCQEYQRLKSELLRLDDILGPHVIAYERWDKLTSDLVFNRTAAELCRLYENLKLQEKAAVDEINAIELANRLIEEKIESIWHAKHLPQDIGDIATEKTFIEIMRVKYVYPDYADLVDPPAKTDFVDVTRRNGTVRRRLTLERQADLLLLGVFKRKEMYIARPHTVDPDASTGWLVFTRSGYQPDDWLGTYYRDYARSLSRTPDRRSDAVTFMPYLNHEARWLHDHLVACDIELGYRPPRTKFQRVRFKDNNRYNCLPDNIVLVEKRGRRMLCVGCGCETISEESKVLRDQGQRLRYCYACLAREL